MNLTPVEEVEEKLEDVDITQMTEQQILQQVEDFWFGAEEEPNWDRNQKPGPWMKKWFYGGPETDKIIKAKF